MFRPVARSGVFHEREFRTLLAAMRRSLPCRPALAADYDPPMIIDQPVEEVPVEVGTGWYLRGDIGYNFSLEADGDFSYRTFDPADQPLQPQHVRHRRPR